MAYPPTSLYQPPGTPLRVMRLIGCLLVWALLFGCGSLPIIAFDSNTGELVKLPSCEEYVHTFNQAYIHWDLVQPYLWELRVAPDTVTVLQRLAEKHELQARNLCGGALALFVEGRSEQYYCRDTFLKNSARQILDINTAFEEARRLKYEDLKKQSGRVEKLLLDYKKRFLPLDQPCGPPQKNYAIETTVETTPVSQAIGKGP